MPQMYDYCSYRRTAPTAAQNVFIALSRGLINDYIWVLNSKSINWCVNLSRLNHATPVIDDATWTLQFAVTFYWTTERTPTHRIMAGIASSGTWLDKAQLYANAANHMLIAAVAFYTTWLCLIEGPGPYVWHTWLCTIGVSRAYLSSLYIHKYRKCLPH